MAERSKTGELTPGEYRGPLRTPGTAVSLAAGDLAKELSSVWYPDVLKTVSGIERIRAIADAVKRFKDATIEYYVGTDQEDEVRQILGRASNLPDNTAGYSSDVGGNWDEALLG